jgi:RNA polymerase sigma-70 factor (ECF subfamily)
VDGGIADADDLAQEAFTAAWLQMPRFRGEASFRSWVCGIAYRKALDASAGRLAAGRGRRRWRDGGPGVAGPEARSGAGLAALPEAQRAAVTLCLGVGLSHEEAAAALAAPLGTVKSHVARGRERLQAVLESADV